MLARHPVTICRNAASPRLRHHDATSSVSHQNAFVPLAYPSKTSEAGDKQR